MHKQFIELLPVIKDVKFTRGRTIRRTHNMLLKSVITWRKILFWVYQSPPCIQLLLKKEKTFRAIIDLMNNWN